MGYENPAMLGVGRSDVSFVRMTVTAFYEH